MFLEIGASVLDKEGGKGIRAKRSNRVSIWRASLNKRVDTKEVHASFGDSKTMMLMALVVDDEPFKQIGRLEQQQNKSSVLKHVVLYF